MTRNRKLPMGASRSGERYAWFVVVVLTLAYMISFVDRYALGLLIQPVKASLLLTDFQIGLLLGPAFALFYVSLGIPAGLYADRGNRMRLLVLGVAFWSLMTAAASLATGFGSLFVTRLGIGVGEAVLAPCAISVISDYFPAHRRARAISFYMSGSLIGAGLAFIGGGALTEALQALQWSVPSMPAEDWWRIAFVLIGLPGLAIALSLLAVREPPRVDEGVDAAGRSGIGQFIRSMQCSPAVYAAILIPMGGVVILGYSSLWYVALFDRAWGSGARDAGLVIGTIYVAASISGTVLCAWLTARLARRGVAHASLACVGIGLAIMLPGYIGFPLMPGVGSAAPLLALAIVGQAIATAAGPAAMMAQCPPASRASASAFYWLVINLFGLSLGPPPIGWLTDWLGGPHHLGAALSIQAAASGMMALSAIIIFGRRMARAA
ncbi:MAG: MFS transporter [Sphingomicrobium sp.]